MTRTAGWVTVLLVIIAAVIIFYMAGGSIDIDADVRTPSVEVEPGRLPNVDVQPAPEAEAGDGE